MVALIAIVAPSVALLTALQSADASSPPSLAISPTGNYHDGQDISVRVGPNGFFTPHSRINIIECADPGGLTSNLPKDVTTCDGNTIQGASIVVGADGSFFVSSYPVYLLPNATLGEEPSYTPVCNETNYCVLYVGQNQNDFTAPKVFSTPFLTSPAAGATSGAADANASSAASAPSSAASTSKSTSTDAGAGVSLQTSATLANTGSPVGIEWIVMAGMALLLCGAVGRRVVLRGAQ